MVTKYISTTGNNGNDGSAGSPWRNLSYACDHATSAGDIIIVNTGDFVETSQCNLREQVHLEGYGIASHIISELDVTRNGNISGAALCLSSGSQGATGNQHIDGVKIDGNYYQGSTGSSSATGNCGILVKRRSGVSIRNTTVEGFYLCGIALHGGDAYSQPSTYATGNEIYNCIITDNGNEDVTWGGGGNIEIGSQSGTIIHSNTISCTGRQDHGLVNGNNISGVHYNKGIKVYDNFLYKNEQESVWNFQIEMWNSEGGWEVYNNEFHGGDTGIDISGDFNRKGDFDYSWYVHDNLFTGDYTISYKKKASIELENGHVEDVWIYRNHFIHKHAPFNVTNGADANVIIERIYFAYNIMEDCGYGIDNDYKEITNFHIPSDMTVQDFYFYNNVYTGNTNAYYTGFHIENNGVANRLFFRNNIIRGFKHPAQAWLRIENNGSMNGLYIDNNVLYDNSNNSNPMLEGNAISNYTFSNNIKADPLFVSSTDFHLQAGSPAIGAGQAMSTPTVWKDYANNTVTEPRESGAYQYGVADIPVTAVTVSGAGGAIIINVNDGTLQMSAHIDPHDATDQSVVWSVVNGTGQASINQSGLLTAIADGTVTVKATSNG